LTGIFGRLLRSWGEVVPKEQLKQLPFISTSLNPVPNAQVCVYLTIHIYNITTANYIFKNFLCFCMSLGIVWRIYVGFVVDIDIKILGVPPSGVGHAFFRHRQMRRGGIIYFCQDFFPCMMPSMDG